jgi:hypothetical protein
MSHLRSRIRSRYAGTWQLGCALALAAVMVVALDHPGAPGTAQTREVRASSAAAPGSIVRDTTPAQYAPAPSIAAQERTWL